MCFGYKQAVGPRCELFTAVWNIPLKRGRAAAAPAVKIGLQTSVCLASLLCFALVPAGRSQAIHRASAVSPESRKPPSRSEYAGDAACASCHAQESATYASTAHHLTSRPADAHSVLGNFALGANVLHTANPALTFRMTADAQGLSETAVDAVSATKNVELTKPIDVVVGSGRKSQTYLYWAEDELFELPVSYWVKTGAWINSPGYVDGAMRFDRPIYPRCLECHGSSFESLAPPANRFAKSSLVLGIECERCHGPAREHVVFYTAHPGVNDEARRSVPAKAKLGSATQGGTPQATLAHGIVDSASLSRERQIDVCAVCHAGLGKPLAPALSFVPGAVLEHFLQFPPIDPTLPVDVHGNQVELLRSSKCFQRSAMTCSTCHNVHEVQRDPVALSKTCLGCHQVQACGRFHALGQSIADRCVECHMPLRKSQLLFSNSNDQTLQLPVREHRIAVYPDLRD